MFNAITIGNFKAFGPAQRIPIRPLTLIFGPNSAGKSSFIHALLFAHEALTSDEPNNLDVRRPRIGGDSVDLGGFRQFVHRGDLTNRVEWGVEIDTAQLRGRLAELLAPCRTVRVTLSIGQPEGVERVTVEQHGEDEPAGEKQVEHESGPRVEAYEIAADDAVLLTASLKRVENQWRLRIDQLDVEHAIMRTTIRALMESMTTTESVSAEDFAAVQQTIDGLIAEGVPLSTGRFLPDGVIRARSDLLQPQGMLFPISRGNRDEDLSAAARLFVPRVVDELVRGLADEVGGRLKRLRYLGPLRSYPQRHLAFSEDHDRNWFAGGGYAWDRVRTDSRLRERVNQWLAGSWMKTPYQLVVRNLYPDEDLYDPIWSTMENVELEIEVDFDRHGTPQGQYATIKDFDREIERFYEQLRKSGIESIRDLVLIDVHRKTTVSHRDVGIGISQVLPVLVSAMAAQDETIAIEQPEIHLHPALQAELGDVFIESALSERGNRFVLETHSEHLILRLLKRIRETTAGKNQSTPPITPDDVMLLYLHVADGQSRFMELRTDIHGRLIDSCPDGFFEEDFAELF